MSESILKALMQLFAIVAKVDDDSFNGREVVISFLKEQLNQELVDEYLEIFDDYVDLHHNISQRKEGQRKRTSLNSVKILKICTQINSELTQKQKVVVLLRIIEFVFSNNQISEQEQEFITTVSDTFNIIQKEFYKALNFIANIENQDDEDEFSTILEINSEKDFNYKNYKHIYSEGFKGKLKVLWTKSVNIYALIYKGEVELILNGQVITPNRVYILNQGSSIRNSKIQPIYFSDIIAKFLSDNDLEKVTFDAINIKYKFKNGDVGLQPLTLREETGKLIGIMGGSGAGKSTLLNVLNGNEIPSEGEVLINGYNIHTEKDKIEGIIGYVSQDDLLIEELTVFENLFYNAKLCFDKLNDAAITKKVYEILNDLGLFEAKDLKVGSPLEKTISGGQRKRVNIALELIREPTVMFVDEPTSGLSSRDSENIMDLLKELASKGKLVFVVIHQPSSDIFKMFDKLLILDLGGYSIYYGNPVEAVIYFKTLVNHANCNESECPTCGNVNPEQIFNIIEAKIVDEYGNLTRKRKTTPLQWNKKYLKKLKIAPSIDKIEKKDLPKISFKVPDKFKQFKVFIQRDVLSKLSNNQYLAINFLEAPILALILAYLVRYYSTDISNTTGYIFRENENITAYLFMCVVVALFIGLTVSAEEIIRDRKILKRESFLNLSKFSYLASKISIMFSLSAIQTFTFIIVGNSILGIKGMYFDYWLILFSTSCFANILGLNISSAFNSVVTIYISIPFLIIPQLLLSGVIVKFDKLNPTLSADNTVPIAGEVMASRWAFEALAVNQYKANKFEAKFYEFDKAKSEAEYKKNFWIPKLKSKLDFISNNISNLERKEQIISDIELLKHEINFELLYNNNVDFPEVNQLDSLINPKSNVLIKAKEYLNTLNRFYIKKYNYSSDNKDLIISKLNKTKEDREKFLELKNNYQNDNLTDLMTNRNELNKIVEKNGQLIQKSDPIYLDPNRTNFRSHFFAPRKKVFNKYIDTFWANIIVLWLMTFSLMFTLYYNLFAKFLDIFSKISDSVLKKK